jgi:hypothetical protein
MEKNQAQATLNLNGGKLLPESFQGKIQKARQLREMMSEMKLIVEHVTAMKPALPCMYFTTSSGRGFPLASRDSIIALALLIFRLANT